MSASRPAVRRRTATLLTAVCLTACGAHRTAPAAEWGVAPPPATLSSSGSPGTALPDAESGPGALPWTGTRLTGTAGSLAWDVVVPRFAGAPVTEEVNRRVVTTNDGRTAQVLLEVVDGTGAPPTPRPPWPPPSSTSPGRGR